MYPRMQEADYIPGAKPQKPVPTNPLKLVRTWHCEPHVISSPQLDSDVMKTSQVPIPKNPETSSSTGLASTPASQPFAASRLPVAQTVISLSPLALMRGREVQVKVPRPVTGAMLVICSSART